MTTADYFADLPYEQAAVVRELTRRYRGMIRGLPSDGSVPSYQVAVEREYNRETFLRYCRLREHE